MNDIYKNTEKYNPNKKHKILVVFVDMIADTFSNKKCGPIVTELFIRGKKLNNSRFYLSYFAVQKNFRINSTQYLIMKAPNK